jgi:hypothetical protein
MEVYFLGLNYIMPDPTFDNIDQGYSAPSNPLEILTTPSSASTSYDRAMLSFSDTTPTAVVTSSPSPTYRPMRETQD